MSTFSHSLEATTIRIVALEKDIENHKKIIVDHESQSKLKQVMLIIVFFFILRETERKLFAFAGRKQEAS
jgi:hypothetical protein